MTMQIKPPITFLDSDGNPAYLFQVYIGKPNLNPRLSANKLVLTDTVSGAAISNPFTVGIDGRPRNANGERVNPTITEPNCSIALDSPGGSEEWAYADIRSDAFGLASGSGEMVDTTFNNFPVAQATDLSSFNFIFIQSETAAWEGTAVGPVNSYYSFRTGSTGAAGTGTFDLFYDADGNEWKIAEISEPVLAPELPVIWNTTSQTGTPLNLGVNVAVYSIGDNQVLVSYNAAPYTTGVYEFVGDTLIEVVTPVNLPDSVTAACGLSSTQIAITYGDHSIGAYNRSNLSLVGIKVSIPSTTSSMESLTAMSSTDVVASGGVPRSLRYLRFDGSNWAQVGNIFDLSVLGAINITTATAISSTDVVLAGDQVITIPTIYNFDGADFSEVVTTGDATAIKSRYISMLNTTDVLLAGEDTVEVGHWSQVMRLIAGHWTIASPKSRLASSMDFSAAYESGVIFWGDVSSTSIQSARLNYTIGTPPFSVS